VAVDAAVTVLELAAEHEVCIVHGAGPQISEEMARYGLRVEFVDGRRVTSPAALVLVRRSLARVNDELCAALGERAVGLIGDEIGLRAQHVPELDGAVAHTLDAGEADRLLDTGELAGGIVPKVRAAVVAARLGVRAEIGATA